MKALPTLGWLGKEEFNLKLSPPAPIPCPMPVASPDPITFSHPVSNIRPSRSRHPLTRSLSLSLSNSRSIHPPPPQSGNVSRGNGRWRWPQWMDPAHTWLDTSGRWKEHSGDIHEIRIWHEVEREELVDCEDPQTILLTSLVPRNVARSLFNKLTSNPWNRGYKRDMATHTMKQAQDCMSTFEWRRRRQDSNNTWTCGRGEAFCVSPPLRVPACPSIPPSHLSLDLGPNAAQLPLIGQPHSSGSLPPSLSPLSVIRLRDD